MSTTTNLAAVAALIVLIAPAPGSAQAPVKGNLQATVGAYAAATKSSRASVQRGGVSLASAQSVTATDGRIVGADPDAAIRFELRRDATTCRY